LIAPEETGELVEEVATTVGDVAIGAIGGVLSSVPGWVWLVAGGAALYFLLGGSKEKERKGTRDE
jgi:hypothetical protein